MMGLFSWLFGPTRAERDAEAYAKELLRQGEAQRMERAARVTPSVAKDPILLHRARQAARDREERENREREQQRRRREEERRREEDVAPMVHSTSRWDGTYAPSCSGISDSSSCSSSDSGSCGGDD